MVVLTPVPLAATFAEVAPELETTWDRLVAGSQAIFKRIFPLPGLKSPVEKIKDIHLMLI